MAEPPLLDCDRIGVDVPPTLQTGDLSLLSSRQADAFLL